MQRKLYICNFWRKYWSPFGTTTQKFKVYEYNESTKKELIVSTKADASQQVSIILEEQAKRFY